MKKLNRYFLLLITLISVQNTYAQTPEWDSIYKTAWTGDFMNFAITKNCEIAAFSNNGFIYHSADTGKTWTPVYNIFSEDKSSYVYVSNKFFEFAPDSIHGISIYKYNSSCYMDITSDGGKTWKHSSSDFTGKTITSFYWKTAETGFLIANGSLYVTNDAGDNWTVVQGGFTHDNFHFCFFSENEGYAFGLGSHYKTTDGGQTWQTYSDPNLYVDKLYKLANGKVLLIGNDDNKTINITTTDSRFLFTKIFWYSDVVPGVITAYNIFSVHELDNGDLYVTKGDGDYYYSSNGATSWEEIGNWGISRFVNDQIVVNVDGNLTTRISYDKGQTWQKYVYEAGEGLESLHIRSKEEFYVISGQNLLHTTDGGVTWETSRFNEKLKNMQFVTNDTIYLSGDKVIYRSINEGQTWERYTTKADGGNLYFITPDVGYLGALRYIPAGTSTVATIIYKTTNAGETWKDADGTATWDWDFGDNYCTSKGDFKSTTEGLMEAKNGLVYTTDGGDNWDFISGITGIPYYINDTWIIVDWRNHKIHTCDEHINCTTTFTDIETYSIQNQRMIDAIRVDENTIMVTYTGDDCAFNDSVIVSRNNGQTWTKEYNPHPTYDITYIDSKTAFGLDANTVTSRVLYKGIIKVQTTVEKFELSTDQTTIHCTIANEAQEDFLATIAIVKNGTDTITISENTTIVNNQEFSITVPSSITKNDSFVVIIEPNDPCYEQSTSESFQITKTDLNQLEKDKHTVTVIGNSITCNCEKFEIYNTIGQRINKNTELQSGVYIVKCGNTIEKVIVKP